MGELKGFLKYERENFQKEDVEQRLTHYNEFIIAPDEEDLKKQGARCMDCGIPFCNYGCPVSNLIPDFNDLVYNGNWKDALETLLRTNNFPEFTGRICPAPCEGACVLYINQPAVSICNIEYSIIEKGYQKGWMTPKPPKARTDKKIAIIGSGPSGLAAADQLNKKGHTVTVFEKNEVLGGLLRLGIPDFKLNKDIVERRIKLMEAEGITFKTNSHVGVDIKAADLTKEYDAVLLTGGAENCRELNIKGRELKGIYQAMEYLTQQNRRVGNRDIKADEINAKGKRVLVIGGGDTGSDCVGTANRQGAKWVKQFELLPEPPKSRAADNPWPNWPLIKRVSTSHQEGVKQYYQVQTKEFIGEKGQLTKIRAVEMEFGPKDPKTGRCPMREKENSAFEMEVDMIFLAIGFTGPIKQGMIDELGLELDPRGNVKTDTNKMSSKKGVFAAGDMATGQSLVVKAIAEGRSAAEGIHNFLSA